MIRFGSQVGLFTLMVLAAMTRAIAGAPPPPEAFGAAPANQFSRDYFRIIAHSVHGGPAVLLPARVAAIEAPLVGLVGAPIAKEHTVVMAYRGVCNGPYSRDYPDFNIVVQFLASRGYAVLQPQFRGSTGFGEAFLKAGYKQWGRLMQDDVTDGARAMIEQGIADPHRICVVGTSQSERMTQALIDAGKVVTVVKLQGDGEDHWQSWPQTRIEVLQQLESFLKRSLQ